MPFLENIGTVEWIIIAIVLIVLFGSKKMTELARGLGESSRELKRAKKEVIRTIRLEGGDEEEEDTKKKKSS